MADESVKLGSEILDYFGQDLIEEFAAFVAYSIENGISKEHEHYSYLSRICPSLDRSSLEKIFEVCRVEIVNIDIERQHLAEKMRQEAINKVAIHPEKFDALRLMIRGCILEGRDNLSARKLGLNEDQFNLLTAYVKEEIARQIEPSRNQLRPKAYEGIGLCGVLTKDGFRIKEVFLGSNAHTNGLKSGDLIVEAMQNGSYIKIGDPSLSDQERVNLIRSAHQYKILQDGKVRIVEIDKQIQNGVYHSSESISDKIRGEIAVRRNQVSHLTPVIPGLNHLRPANGQGYTR